MINSQKIRCSVVIVAKNEEKNIVNCIEGLLTQELVPDEIIIIVDPSSNDNTLQIAKNYTNITEIKIYIGYGGLAIDRNLGVEHSSGDIIAFVDADAVPDIHWLRKLLSPFEKSDNNVGAFGTIITDTYTVLPFRVAPVGHAYVTCNFAIRRNAFILLNGFDKKFVKLGEDLDLALRLEQIGSIIKVEDAIVLHPAKTLKFKGVILSGLRSQDDCLLYKKHGKRSVRGFGILYKPIIGPFSTAGIFYFLFILLFFNKLIFGSFMIKDIIFVMAILAILLLFFIAKFYKFAVIPYTNIPVSIRLKAFFYLMLSSFAIITGRMYGSIKFRKILL